MQGYFTVKCVARWMQGLQQSAHSELMRHYWPLLTAVLSLVEKNYWLLEFLLFNPASGCCAEFCLQLTLVIGLDIILTHDACFDWGIFRQWPQCKCYNIGLNLGVTALSSGQKDIASRTDVSWLFYKHNFYSVNLFLVVVLVTSWIVFFQNISVVGTAGC